MRSSYADLQTDAAIDGAFGQNINSGAAQVLRAGNTQRIVLFLTNPSDTDMWIGLGEDPVATAGSETGLILKAGGGAMTIGEWKGDVRVAHAAGVAKRITGAEI